MLRTIPLSILVLAVPLFVFAQHSGGGSSGGSSSGSSSGGGSHASGGSSAELVAVRTVRAGRRLQVTVAERPTLDRVVRHRRLRIREALPMA